MDQNQKEGLDLARKPPPKAPERGQIPLKPDFQILNKIKGLVYLALVGDKPHRHRRRIGAINP